MNAQFRRVALYALILLMFAPSLWSQRAPFVEKYFKAAQSAHSAGNLADARTNLNLVLERTADHVEALVLMARINLKEERSDYAFAGLEHAILLGEEIAAPSPQEVAAIESAKKLQVEHDQRAESVRTDIASHGKYLMREVIRLEKLQLYIAAFRLLNRVEELQGSSVESRTIRKRLLSEGPNDIAVEDIAGGSDPLAGISAAWIAKHDEEHSDWAKHAIKETEHYTIKTNAGYEVLVIAATICEQLHSMYRDFYGVPSDREVRKVEVKIFKTNAEFQNYAPEGMKTAGGYFAGKEIVTYDTGGNRGHLWETLAHEASHQFTSLVSRGWQPTWLNEGTATWFEGVRILSNGRVRRNLIPRYSNRLASFLRHTKGQESFTLSEILTTKPGLSNYTGIHYSYGWALIYFLYNFTDDKGRLAYRETLKSYLVEGFAKQVESTQHVNDFEMRVIKPAKVAGIADLKSFEKVWKSWIADLGNTSTGKTDPIDSWMTTARLCAANKKLLDVADEFVTRVLQRNPVHEEALALGAQVAWKLKNRDRAFDRYSRLLFITGESKEAKKRPEIRVARKRASNLDRKRFQLKSRKKKIIEILSAHVNAYEEGGHPRRAIQIAKRIEGFGQSPSTKRPSEELMARHDIATSRWSVLFNERDIREWDYAEDGSPFGVEGDELIGEFDEPDVNLVVPYRVLFSRRKISGDFTFSTNLAEDPKKKCRMIGICFGIKNADDFMAMVYFPRHGVLDLAEHSGDSWRLIKRVNAGYWKKGSWAPAIIEVKGGKARLQFRGKEPFKNQGLTVDQLTGRIGLLMGGGKARYRHLRLYSEPE
ncbi:MAG: hypothetical protein ACI97A_003109 [Planctomycetota bacterium]|jgi:hypothetical protein